MNYKNMRNALAAFSTVALIAACGGGGGGDSGTGTGGTSNPGDGGAAGGGSTPVVPAYADKPATKADAARFLNQATFGATDAEVDKVMSMGYAAWIDAQMALPVDDNSHRKYMEAVVGTMEANNQNYDQQYFFQSWWKQALTSDDQLRQRVAFALSQILVISYQNDTLGGQSQNVRGTASYYDMLERNAFGNYRTMLNDVTFHPMMGYYLTSLRNTKETIQNGVVTRTPDENYAREVMQLFTIGLLQLNPDGTTVNGADGKPLETYTKDDIAGMAKIFTGLSWGAPAGATDVTSNGRFNGGGSPANVDKEIQPMQCYPQYHSITEKKFLGKTIGVQSSATVDSCNVDLKLALDTLFNHTNIGPFISERLIKQFVTSNPTPAYVGAVAAKFNDNGAGVKGDMKAVVKAMLLHPEARIARSPAVDTTFGKLREPILTVSQWLRASETKSAAVGVNQAQRYLIGYTDNTLQETPMRSPGVFNFWRPGYVPPSSALGDKNLTSPEMQVVQELSVTTYLNSMRNWVDQGIGNGVQVGTTNVRDLKPAYTKEIALAADPAALTDRMNVLYMGGMMTQATRDAITESVTSVAIPVLNTAGTNQAAIDSAKLNRVKLAVFMTVGSPDYLSQK
ncbi:DUF1800 family protein [soil metagenome]